MNYEVIINEKKIVYGPLITRSRFSNEEWSAIHKAMIERHYSDQFIEKLDDEDFVRFTGEFIDLSERYEALLELLPQSSYSKAGTHPSWVADEVERNTLIKDLTKDDIKDMIDDIDDVEVLKESLKEYFEIEEVK